MAAATPSEEDPLVVERRQQHVPGVAGATEHELVGNEDVEIGLPLSLPTRTCGSSGSHYWIVFPIVMFNGISREL